VDIDDVTPGDGVVVHHGQQLGDGIGVETGGIGFGAVEAVSSAPKKAKRTV
jgi:hypothetical protein